MLRLSVSVGVLSGILFALGKQPESLIASGYILLVLIGFGKLIIGKSKPFGSDFWSAVFVLLITPFVLCQAIFWIGWLYIIIGLAISALLYISFNTPVFEKPKEIGGERTPIDPHFGEYSWNEFEEN